MRRESLNVCLAATLVALSFSLPEIFSPLKINIANTRYV